MIRLIIALVTLSNIATAATITVQSPVTIVGLGTFATVDIAISSAVDLYAWQLDLTFNPLVLAASNITEGTFLAGGGATVFLSGTIDNTIGTIVTNGNSLQGAIPGASGNGQLMQVQFQTLGLGVSSITLSNVILLDSSLDFITADTVDGATTVVAGVPEPASLSLLFLGLLALGVLSLSGKRVSASQRARCVTVAATLGIAATSTHPVQAADVTTAQYDAARSSANVSEIYLTTSNVNVSRFGKLFSRVVDGAIYAQPLYLQNVVIAGKKANVVYVATSHNNVYAFDADDVNASAPIWSAALGQYVTRSGWNTGLGIVSTPVIIRNLGAIYLTTATTENNSRVYRLHALDLLTGAEKFGGPVVIAGSVSGTSLDAVNGIVTFNPNYHIQRTGIALAGNNLILGFAPDRDQSPYHGWVFSYDIGSLQRTGLFNTTPNDPNVTSGSGAGLWQSGRAPAVDTSGSVYFETGNGVFDGAANFGESFVKLTSGQSGLSLSDWFTPSAWSALNDLDWDLGSTGPTLIPGTNLVFGGSKSGTVYLLATNNLGHLSTNDSNIVQSFTATTGCAIPYTGISCAQIMGQVFWSAAPVPTMYVWGVHDVARSYQFSSGKFSTAPTSTGTTQAYYPGGLLTLSSYLGTAGTGILWATTCETNEGGFFFGPGFNGTAKLRALDANNLGNELWNSDQNILRDALGSCANFSSPLAVNGKVYVPTFSNQLAVYGLLNGPVAGDINGDSTVNCADLSILKASFGKSSTQLGFDMRADVNGDGVVNILDLAAVSRQLPAGSVCK